MNNIKPRTLPEGRFKTNESSIQHDLIDLREYGFR